MKRFVVEGEKFVSEIPENWNVRYYAFSKSYFDANETERFRLRAPCSVVKDSYFENLSEYVTPQGILAVCDQKNYPLDEILKPNAFLLLGERLSDPGNIGTLIRTAAAAGADGFILTEGSAEIYNPKIIRASAGASMRLPVVAEIEMKNAVERLKQNGVLIYASCVDGKTPPYEADFTAGFCLLIGNESRGLTDEAAAFADNRIRIPMENGIDSLNAAVAGSILIYEAVRQRKIINSLRNV